MTLKGELYALFNEGKTPSECINLGYKRATAYRFYKDYNMDKEKERIKVLINESEQIKKVFPDFKENKNLIQIVTDHGISPDRVLNCMRNTLNLLRKRLNIKRSLRKSTRFRVEKMIWNLKLKG